MHNISFGLSHYSHDASLPSATQSIFLVHSHSLVSLSSSTPSRFVNFHSPAL